MTTRVTTARARRNYRYDVNWPLTPTQLRVLELRSHGLTGIQVARVLHMSIDTVKTHTRRLLSRLDAVNVTHAVRLGFERGLLSREPRTAVDDLVSVPESELDDEVDEEVTGG